MKFASKLTAGSDVFGSTLSSNIELIIGWLRLFSTQSKLDLCMLHEKKKTKKKKASSFAPESYHYNCCDEKGRNCKYKSVRPNPAYNGFCIEWHPVPFVIDKIHCSNNLASKRSTLRGSCSNLVKPSITVFEAPLMEQCRGRLETVNMFLRR